MTDCTCIADVNAHLKDHGGELVVSLFAEPQRTFISTMHRTGVKPRRKLPLVAATFCPFCGRKYAEDRAPLSKLKEASTP